MINTDRIAKTNATESDQDKMCCQFVFDAYNVLVGDIYTKMTAQLFQIVSI